MVGTTDDSPRSWLGAGQAIGRLLLTLTAAGLSSQPLGQAIDIESTRQRLSRQLGLVGHVQFLMRTGEGRSQPATGRRHLARAYPGRT